MGEKSRWSGHSWSTARFLGSSNRVALLGGILFILVSLIFPELISNVGYAIGPSSRAILQSRFLSVVLFFIGILLLFVGAYSRPNNKVL